MSGIMFQIQWLSVCSRS